MPVTPTNKKKLAPLASATKETTDSKPTDRPKKKVLIHQNTNKKITHTHHHPKQSINYDSHHLLCQINSVILVLHTTRPSPRPVVLHRRLRANRFKRRSMSQVKEKLCTKLAMDKDWSFLKAKFSRSLNDF